jgi:hypothetical protein
VAEYLLALTSPWDSPCWFASAGVTFRACELTFEVREGSDDLGCLKGTIAPTHGDLAKDACIDEPLNGVSGRIEGPADESSGAVHCKDRGAGKTPEEKVGRGVGADRAEPSTWTLVI